MTDELTFPQKAERAWGDSLPDWVRELAHLAERDALKGCSKFLGCSTTMISQAISNKYPGKLSDLEAKVRGALMGEMVQCPVLGEIGRNDCLHWQDKRRVSTNSVRAELYRACRNGCPHSRLKGGGNAS
ncbi:putative transcriptional regulator [Roseibium sp. TrichSKD4]|uniref:hypothetical protein n=1 Tax=Roseibium sp. TrichSKD4 TaxID=744980 RepID=UPI0001E56D3A|nr:hypothetical protein [Roseibium sp. TrichSKD4]EFO33251.1 putative transcriptional regulator [Roseibium sp. TrichSKD4]